MKYKKKGYDITMKKSILSLLFAFIAGITLFSALPVSADTVTTEESNALTVQNERDLMLTQQFKENMIFLILLNHERIEEGLHPLAVTKEMLQSAQIRSGEIETGYDKIRPDGTLFASVFAETGAMSQTALHNIIQLHMDDYTAIELPGADTTNPAVLFEGLMDKYSLHLYHRNYTHLGLGHSGGKTIINNKECTEPWILELFGQYTPVSIELYNVKDIPYPEGMSVTDMGIVLKLTVKDADGKEHMSYLPVLQNMCSGYNTTSKAGKHKITVTYKYTASKKTIKLSKSFEIITKKASKPSTPTNFKAVGTSHDEVTITWSPVDDVNGYELYRSTKKKSGYKKVDTLKPRKLSLTEDGLYTYTDDDKVSGQMYYYKIRAFRGNTKSSYSKVDEAKPNIAAPTNLKATSIKKNSIKIKWSKAEHATTYRVYYATKENGKYKRATNVSTKKTSFTIKKLKKGKTYYIKVLSYKGSKPGRYSTIIKVKTKK